MEDEALAALALRYGGQASGGGHGPGLPRPAFQHRDRAGLLRALRTRQQHTNFQRQAAHSNQTGRHRTRDFIMPSSGERKPAKGMGSGKWKSWTADAVLRAAFSKESMAARDVASQVDGGSAKHASDCKVFVAELAMQGQANGVDQYLREAVAAEGILPFALTNMLFDETELELNLPNYGQGSWSILASHSQMTFRASGQTFDVDVIRVPRAIPNKQASTMWGALSGDLGGLWPGLSSVPAKFRAVLTTCDAAPANIKLLKHLQAVLDNAAMLFPFLCLQHRTGNVVERITKLLSVLTGAYAVTKTLRSGAVVRRLTAYVKEVLSEKLLILDDVPPGSMGEWASGQVCARAILDLVKEEQAADGQAEAESGEIYDEFLRFLAGPWTGQGCGFFHAGTLFE